MDQDGLLTTWLALLSMLWTLYRMKKLPEHNHYTDTQSNFYQKHELEIHRSYAVVVAMEDICSLLPGDQYSTGQGRFSNSLGFLYSRPYMG